MKNSGVVYYNAGNSCCVRMLVSAWSLRQFYDGPISIISEGFESHAVSQRIAEAVSADFLEWDSELGEGGNRPYVAKTLLNTATPYQLTVALDSDTLVVGKIDELFREVELHGFCVAQFSNWNSKGRIVKRRLQQWNEIASDDVPHALSFGPAINTGVLGFSREAAIFKEWQELALRGRGLFIPDEVSCQLILHRYQHKVLGSQWNRSCKYDDPDKDDTRIIHYHGRKHCRRGLPFHGHKWVKQYETVASKNIAGVNEWTPAGDRMLRKFLSTAPPKERTQSLRSTELCKSHGDEFRLVLGAGRTRYSGWTITDKETLDVTAPGAWKSVTNGRSVSRILAEHVWEHLTPGEMRQANGLAFANLKTGGSMRIAVPDGLFPDKDYISRVKVNGLGPSADSHKQLLDYRSLSDALTQAGFEVELLEYWDERGYFHHKPWDSEEGHVKRSALNDRRNRNGRLRYTSVIADAWKRESQLSAPR